MIGDSRDGGGRLPIQLVSTGLSKQGSGRLLRPLISAWACVPSGLQWIQQVKVDDNSSTMRETEGAELGPRKPALGLQHHAEGRASHNRCVRPPYQRAAGVVQHFNHSTRTTLHQSWERASKQGVY